MRFILIYVAFVFYSANIYAQNDSTSVKNDSIPTPLIIEKPERFRMVDKKDKAKNNYEYFKLEHRKRMRSIIISNILYAGGAGLYYGFVIPQYAKTNDFKESLKIMPFAVITVGMMYVSTPMSCARSKGGNKDYAKYFDAESAARNLTWPIFFVGAGCYMSAIIISYVDLVKDIRDDKEYNQSVHSDFVDYSLIGTNIVWSVTNVNALIYTFYLGKKAEKQHYNRNDKLSAKMSLFPTVSSYGTPGVSLLYKF